MLLCLRTGLLLCLYIPLRICLLLCQLLRS